MPDSVCVVTRIKRRYGLVWLEKNDRQFLRFLWQIFSFSFSYSFCSCWQILIQGRRNDTLYEPSYIVLHCFLFVFDGKEVQCFKMSRWILKPLWFKVKIFSRHFGIIDHAQETPETRFRGLVLGNKSTDNSSSSSSDRYSDQSPGAKRDWYKHKVSERL